MVTSPMDFIKIRFQVQLEPASSWALLRKDMYGSSKYTKMMQATKDILRQEGLLEDYIHFSPCLSYLSRALAGSATNPNVYTTMTYAFVDIVRSQKVVCHYLDVVKNRFQIIGLPRDPFYGAWVEHHAYNGISDALRCILVTEGWAGLYKARAVTFVTYEYTSEWLESHLTWNIV
ncbi:hypothetical protein MKW92_034593 [Papaver armeniacum]|nr:hypothetical protein MKW92_034593 [Papaver armeniacum]